MRVPKSLALPALLAAALALPGACSGVDGDRREGDRLAKERRWKEAVEAYEKALAAYPYDYDAAWGIAKIYCLEVHLAPKCLAWTDRLLDAYPDDTRYRRAAAQGWRDTAKSARDRGDTAAAEEADRKATALTGGR
jgi:tetratricopeptide (TPR) repeat protein